MSTGSTYLHGTTPEEQRRLGLLNRLLNERALHEMALQPGASILDVGSGLGQFTRLMAAGAGTNGRIVAVERSREQISEALRLAVEAGEAERVEFRQGDALALPLQPDEWGRFDVAHTRFLLEHVPDPLAVVRGLVQAVRPGGRVVLADDDHDVMRLWPEPPGFNALWRAYMRAFGEVGNDAIVGRRLVALLHEAGALPKRNTWIFFGSCAGSEDFEACVQNLIGVIATARATVLEARLLDEQSFDQGLETLAAWGRRPDAAIWYALAWAEGVRAI